MRSKSFILFVAALSLAACSSGASTSQTSAPRSSAPAASTAATSADTEPAPTGVATTETATTEVAKTEPASTEPVPTEPATTEPAATEPPTTVAAADVAAAPSSACSTVTNAAGESTIPFTAVGLTATYILHLPPAVAGGDPLPLVLDLHGYSEPAAIQVVQSGLTTLGDTAGFVTALPQIDRPVPRWDSTVGSDDGKFLGALLDQIEATVCIDTNREYVAGLSNGAFETSIVACDLSDRIAAVAPVAGIQAPDDCKPTRAVPVIAFHGTADTFVPYTGGLGSSVASLPSADGTGTIGTTGTAPPSSDPVSQGPSVPDRASTWAVRNGCAASPTEETVAADVTLLRYDCPAGAEVELYRVEGGGHAWPGSAFSVQIESVVGKTTLSIDATKLIWEFF
ncbi:MAG: poly(3-hydroxybutyrate) depolymerase, partial [Acidimicrobiales bacterium]|nr:poly(3-hydroxybutyrate) depolymerase [Acidimicrobiales bacterium]